MSRDLFYIAGPMTGYPHFNIPAFDDAARMLRSFGYDVVSPAELDDPADRAAAEASPDGHPIHYESGKTWGDFLARDVKLLADGGVTAMVVLPGWEKSRGARLETFVGAGLMKMDVYLFDPIWLPHMDRVLVYRLSEAWSRDLPIDVRYPWWLDTDGEESWSEAPGAAR